MKKLLNKLFTPREPLWDTQSNTLKQFNSHIARQNAVVQEIHDTFYSEVDRLLAEAGIKLSTETDKAELISKAKRLEKLGFKSTKEVSIASEESIRLEQINETNTKKQDLINAINHFSFKYPQYKFITEESVKKICEKYGLIYGEVSLYKGEVPDKNLEQIEKFTVKDEDCAFTIARRSSFSFGYSYHTIDYAQQTRNKKEFEDYNSRTHDDHISLRHDYYGHLRDQIGYRASLEIAAPVKDFDTTNMELKDFKLSKIEIPDPVVLHPVMFRGTKHYLIVTAWGLEASDELVVNQRNN